ncbi:hypothetical protein H1R20_g343, partial [Candolleomyces eurysporus]
MPAMFIFDWGLTRISNVLSTIKLSGLNLIHAGKAVVLASRPGATRVLEIAAEAFAPVVEEVAVPVLEVVEEVAPAVNVATVSVVEPVSESLIPVVEVVAKAADPVTDIATNITGPIIEVVQEIVSPFVSPTVEIAKELSLPAGPLPELLDFTLSEGPQFVRLGQMDLISDSVEMHSRSFDATAVYCIFLLSFFIWGWVRCIRRRIAEPETGFAASRARRAYFPVPVLQLVSSLFSRPQAAYSPVPITVLSDGFALDKDLLRVATFQTFVNGFAQDNGLSHSATTELCNSYITGSFPTVVSPAPPSGLSPSASVGEVAEPSGSREGDDDSSTSVSPPVETPENAFTRLDGTPVRRRRASIDMSDAFVESENSRAARTARSAEQHVSPRNWQVALDRARELAASLEEGFGSDLENGGRIDISILEGLDLTTLFCLHMELTSGWRGTPEPFRFKRNVAFSKPDMSFEEDDLEDEIPPLISRSNSGSEYESEYESDTEQAYEARFSRSNAPSPAGDIGLMVNGFSVSEDRSGSLGDSSDEGAELAEDEDEEVTAQDVNEPNGSVSTVELP